MDIAKKVFVSGLDNVECAPCEVAKESSSHRFQCCPIFAAYKFCPSGLNCEWYQDHTDFETTGKNHGIPTDSDRLAELKTICSHIQDGFNEKSIIDYPTKHLLRKRTYDFSKSDAVMKKVFEICPKGENNRTKETKEGPGLVESSKWEVNEDRQRKIFDLRENLRSKRILAPLTTVGNLPFRRLCVEMGAEVTVGEMALAESILQGHKSEIALLRKHSSEAIFGVQITCGNATVMTKAAEFIEREVDCDFVDINAACPLDQLHNKGCGSMLSCRTNVLQQMIRGMTSVLDTKLLTCKIRISHYDSDPRFNALKLCPLMAEWGVDGVVLHGRTARQRYAKLANWEYVGGVKQALNGTNVPLIGCGDVLNYEDYERHLHNSSDSVMIGRGALIKPWIFSEIRDRKHLDVSATERLDLVKKFCQYGLEHWGSDTRGVNNTRRFLLEWLSFYHRYLPVGLLERGHTNMQMNWRPPSYMGRNDLETLLSSPRACDWIKISEMFLGKSSDDFSFVPKHKSASY